MNAQARPTSDIFPRPKDVMRIYGISRATLYRWIRQGILPPATKLSTKFSGWPIEVIKDSLGAPPKPKENTDQEKLIDSLVRFHSLTLNQSPIFSEDSISSIEFNNAQYLSSENERETSKKELNQAESLVDLITHLLDQTISTKEKHESLYLSLQKMKKRISSTLESIEKAGVK